MASKLYNRKRPKKPESELIFAASPPELLVQWTPDSVRGAFAAQASGDFRNAVLFCQVLLQDDRISIGLQKRVRALFKHQILFESGKRFPGKEREVSEVSSEADEDWRFGVQEQALEQIHMWGLLMGWSVGQLQWFRRKEFGDRDCPRLHAVSSKDVLYSDFEKTWFFYSNEGERIPITSGDGRWCQYFPHGEREPWLYGLWYKLAPLFLLKQLSFSYFLTHNRQHGSANRIGITPTGTLDEYRQVYADDLRRLISGGSLALPPGYDVKLLESTVDASRAFERAINLANTCIDIAIHGNNLTTEVSGGSLAAAQIHESVEHGQIQSDGEVLGNFAHDTILTPWAWYNHGDLSEAPWPYWDTEPPEDKKQLADTQKAGGEAVQVWNTALSGTPYRVDVVAYAEKHKIPLIENENNETKPVQAS